MNIGLNYLLVAKSSNIQYRLGFISQPAGGGFNEKD